MTREEQINEAGYIAAGTTAMEGDMGFDIGFMLGAQWADNHLRSPWVSTKKKLPKAINIEEVDDCGNIQWCACHTEKCHVSYFVGYYADSIDGEHKVWCDIAGQEVCGPYDVDYWMPIPAIPKKGGAK